MNSHFYQAYSLGVLTLWMRRATYFELALKQSEGAGSGRVCRHFPCHSAHLLHLLLYTTSIVINKFGSGRSLTSTCTILSTSSSSLHFCSLITIYIPAELGISFYLGDQFFSMCCTSVDPLDTVWLKMLADLLA